MAITGNGYIAKENDDTSWISKVEWDSYSSIVRKAGNLIIGHRTYGILTKQPEFVEFKKIKIIIVSHKNFKTLNSNHIIAKTTKEALRLLKGFENIIVAGGGTLNTSFIAGNLVDEIYLDIEPIVFGKGIRLFGKADFETKLKLLDIKKLSDNEVQLHYQVLK
ncbi:MAG: dihydrofolate reductase family protein [Candidatus Levybacteria bacterium]|nr:dihydrofolate reductase family protein [Candidatus Levybacteria bacterium]